MGLSTAEIFSVEVGAQQALIFYYVLFQPVKTIPFAMYFTLYLGAPQYASDLLVPLPRLEAVVLAGVIHFAAVCR